MSRKLIRLGLTSSQALLGLAAVLLATEAHAGTKDAPLSEDTEDALKGEAAIFARFGDLGTEETEKRLEELLGKDDTAELVVAVGKALSSDDVTAKDIEKSMLSLLKGLKADASDATLAALMLDYYEQQVRDRLDAGKLGLNDAFDLMNDRAEVVVTAAYGSVAARDSRDRRVRTIRTLRRRI